MISTLTTVFHDTSITSNVLHIVKSFGYWITIIATGHVIPF